MLTISVLFNISDEMSLLFYYILLYFLNSFLYIIYSNENWILYIFVNLVLWNESMKDETLVFQSKQAFFFELETLFYMHMYISSNEIYVEFVGMNKAKTLEENI